MEIKGSCFCDPGVSIGMHIFVGSKAPWEDSPEGILMYEEGTPNL